VRLIILIFLSTALTALEAHSQEPGTYRAGNTYLSVPASSPNQCVQQCQGDAQCKSWNFVRVSPNRSICEFNARMVPPVQNALSISGDNATATDSSRIISAGHRTRRLGQANVTPAFSSGSVTRIGAIPTPQSRPAPTRVMRRLAPQPGHKPQPAVTQQRPAYRHSLDTARNTGTARQNTQRQTQQPQFRPHLETINSAARPTARPAPQPANPIPVLESKNAPSYASAAPKPDNVRAQGPQRPPALSDIPQNQPRPSLESGLAGGPAPKPATDKNSLYGSLFDDVKAPRALNPSDIPLDPDAPIPTVAPTRRNQANTTNRI